MARVSTSVRTKVEHSARLVERDGSQERHFPWQTDEDTLLENRSFVGNGITAYVFPAKKTIRGK
jgi:hypothetical protein